MKIVRVSNNDIAYEEHGKGRPVLLVHGFPLDHTMWDAQAAVLARTHRVIAPDLCGFGQTPLAATEAEADDLAARGITMQEYADDLAAFLDALRIDEPVILAGFSMGGYAAWPFWKMHRDRLRALVLCDTRAIADSEEARRGRLDMAEHVAEWGSGRVAEMMLPKLFAPKSFVDRPDVVAATKTVIESTDPRAIAAAQRGMAERMDVTDWLPRIEVPALVLVGEEDAISRVEEMQSIASALPRAEFHVIPGAGHMAPVENADGVNAAVAKFIETLR